MRHRKSFNHLKRKSGHRKALMANMASSLILHKRIKTTMAKAKALRSYVEPLITKTKDLSTVEEKTHAQRVVFSYLQNKYAVSELFGDVATKVDTRPGGYTRILKLGNRPGDNADICFIELVDYNENMLEAKESKKTTRRSRRGGSGKKQSSGQATATTATQEATNAPETETTEESPKAETTETETAEATEVKAEANEADTAAESTEQTDETDAKEENTEDKAEGDKKE